MDQKMVMVNQKKAKQQQQQQQQQQPNNKSKKKGPLKVVYITNPIKIKASPSEFRALVQELTGQYSNVPDSAAFTATGGDVACSSEAAAAVEENVHVIEEVMKLGKNDNEGTALNGLDPFGFGSYDGVTNDDVFCNPEMSMDNYCEGLMASSFWHEDEFNKSKMDMQCKFDDD